MTAADAEAVHDLKVRTFDDLDRRYGRDPGPPADPAAGLIRIRHLTETDPTGAWVAEAGGEVVGAALALVRDGLWGLSLLIVDPGHQSGGLGRALLQAALEAADGARGGLILASEDPRALRAYARAGFGLRPCVDAHGTIRRAPAAPAAVRPGRWPDDRELVEAVGRHVRGAGHGRDIDAVLAAGRRLLVHDGGGFAITSGGGTVFLVAATTEDVAAELLRAELAAAGEGAPASADFISAGQDWAIEVLLEAGLDLRPSGATMVRGDVGPLRPYIPSGAYL
jgi:GNAT superfamily N-acetyltransferase